MAATYREIIGDIKKGKFSPVYILHGEEPYYIDKIIEALEKNVVDEADKDFDQNIFYGADVEPGVILESASKFPFVSGRQLVVLKEAQTMQRGKANLDKLAEYVKKPNQATVLVVSYKGDKLNSTSALMKAVKSNKDVVAFESPKIKEYKLGEVIREYCNAEKIKIEDQAIELLAAFIGANLTSIFKEIDKLLVVAKDSRAISADMVKDYVGISREFNNFELVNALARKDYFQTMNIVKHFSNNPKDNPAIVTAGVIFNFFQKLVIALFNSDKSDKGLMEALQLNTPYPLREIRTGMSSYNATQAIKAITSLREFDIKSKGVDSFQKEHPLLLELVFKIITV